MDATSQFRLTAYDINGKGVMQSTVSGLTNTIANKVQALSLNVITSPSQLNQVQTFSISLTLFNEIYMGDGDYLKLDLPTGYTFIGSSTSANLCSNTNLNCTIPDSNNPNSIKVSSTSILTSTSSLTLTIKTGNYVSPSDFGY